MTTLEIILIVGIALQLVSYLSWRREYATVRERVTDIEAAIWPSKTAGKTFKPLDEEQEARVETVARMIANPPAELRAVLARNGWERGS